MSPPRTCASRGCSAIAIYVPRVVLYTEHGTGELSCPVGELALCAHCQSMVHGVADLLGATYLTHLAAERLAAGKALPDHAEVMWERLLPTLRVLP